jgi:hypothetical protein
LLDRHCSSGGWIADGRARTHGPSGLGHALRIVQHILHRRAGPGNRCTTPTPTSALISTRSPQVEVSSMGRRRLLAARNPSVRSQEGDWMVSTSDTKQRS